jgi:hypothetical protein
VAKFPPFEPQQRKALNKKAKKKKNQLDKQAVVCHMLQIK